MCGGRVVSGRKWLSAAALGAALVSFGGCAESVAVPGWTENRPRDVDCSVVYAEPEICHDRGRLRAASGRGDAAGRPPDLNVATTCETAAASAGTLGRDKQTCLSEEHTAMESVTKNWSQYGSTEKSSAPG